MKRARAAELELDDPLVWNRTYTMEQSTMKGKTLFHAGRLEPSGMLGDFAAITQPMRDGYERSVEAQARLCRAGQHPDAALTVRGGVDWCRACDRRAD